MAGSRGSTSFAQLIVRLAWMSCLLTMVLVGLTVVLDVLIVSNQSVSSRLGRYAYVTLAVPISLAGALITVRRTGNRIGVLMLVAGLSVACDQFAWDYVHYCRTHGLVPVWVIGWVGNWMWVVPPTTLLFALLLYPNGRLPGRRWRAMAWLIVAWASVTVGLAALGAGVYNGPPLDGDAVLSGGAADALNAVMPGLFAVFPVMLLGVAGAVIIRFRRAQGVERAQLKWLAYAGSLVGLVWVLPPVHQVGSWQRAAANLVLWTVPTAIGIAILRYRLYEIDRVINRTLLYGSLTACVGGAYLLIATSLGAVFEPRSGVEFSLVASAVVAVIFAPLRARLQRAVDRLLYGQRREPSAVMSQLGRRLEDVLPPDQVLPAIVETVAQALKLPYVAIELNRDAYMEPVCVRGVLEGEPAEFALTYRGDVVGRLVAGPRAPGEAFSPADRGLLQDLARHAGIAVHAVRLTADLQRSRERLVTAREEERRRLRRDLHDGLGPTLAGMAFELEAAARLLPVKPGHTAELLVKLKSDMKQTIVEVRRLVDGLRPPALDELGLVPAICQYGARFSSVDPDGRQLAEFVTIDVNAPSSIPQLPAAVEVAVYRIATEAITNVLRHANARRCTVDIRIDDVLELEVTDDGRGMTGTGRIGFGLSSMRERAAELGGTCVVESDPGAGTRVFVRLPLTLGD